MKVKIKESSHTKEHYGSNWEINFAGYTGEYKGNTVYFDKKSKEKLPKGWIKEGEKLGFDPYAYVVMEEDVEVIDEN